MPLNEADTRHNLIDPKLEAAGWILQDRDQLNLFAGRGIAVREFPLETDYFDYFPLLDKKPAREEAWTRQLWIYDLRTNQRRSMD